MAGLVSVDGRRMDKPGAATAAAAVLEVAAREPYASRAGRKLAHALDHFGIDPSGWVCLDVGASTGGFAEVLVLRGARRVYAASWQRRSPNKGAGRCADGLSASG